MSLVAEVRSNACRGGLVLALSGAALLLAACAPTLPHTVKAGRAELALPRGDWIDLGTSDETLPSSVAFPGGPQTQTRAMGLRGPGQELLAVLLVQSNRSNNWNRTLWNGNCPARQDMWVQDAAQSSPVRIDCLRFKRRADADGWLAKNQPEVVQWLAQRQITPNRPYAFLNYRYTTESGGYIAINAVVDQRLLVPRTRNNEEFLVSGLPAIDWTQRMAQAARLSTAMLDGHLAVPAFPMALPNQTR
jgi:hypothetical protein